MESSIKNQTLENQSKCKHCPLEKGSPCSLIKGEIVDGCKEVLTNMKAAFINRNKKTGYLEKYLHLNLKLEALKKINPR